ncbi:MAG: hypothetical protein ACK4SF_20200 [Algoriphagus aquaeductus]|uniref:hypothetical protein n=1 Tax=Algoriphagus aquaeductus TaxID=475299 RepID=UPI003918F8CD
MKKYQLFLSTGAILWCAACDPLNTENVSPEREEWNQAESGDLAHARVGFDLKINQKVNQIYGLTEATYQELLQEEGFREAKLTLRKAGDRRQYLTEMLRLSLHKYDNVVLKRGNFLSPLAKRNHQAMMQEIPQFDYDLDGYYDPQALTPIYIEYEGIPGELTSEPTEEISFNFTKITHHGATSSDPDCKSPWCNIPAPIRGAQMLKVIRFLEELPRYAQDPSRMNQALEQLEIDAGLDPVAIALLLPAVQKVRESAGRSSTKGGISVAAGDINGFYNPESGNLHGAFLVLGAYGSLGKFIRTDYDDTGDLDWALIQLHRKKFELEMFLLWSEFWNNEAGNER